MKLKKTLWLLTAAVLALMLSACGYTLTKKAPDPMTMPTDLRLALEETPQDTAKSRDYYYGTWAVAGVTNGQQTATLNQVVKGGNEAYRELRLILQNTGSYWCQNTTGKWETTDRGVLCGSEELTLNNDYLLLKLNNEGYYLLLHKITTGQELPGTSSQKQLPSVLPPSQEQSTQEPASAPSDSKTEAPASGLRPEFKEAMDAYEAFYDQFIEVTNAYFKNPIDNMTKYIEVVGKLDRMEELFDEWGNKDLNKEEKAYYDEVETRILGKTAGMAIDMLR